MAVHSGHRHRRGHGCRARPRHGLPIADRHPAHTRACRLSLVASRIGTTRCGTPLLWLPMRLAVAARSRLDQIEPAKDYHRGYRLTLPQRTETRAEGMSTECNEAQIGFWLILKIYGIPRPIDGGGRVTVYHQRGSSALQARMASSGHEERLPPTRQCSAGYGFRKETIAGVRHNKRDAPEAVIHGSSETEHQRSRALQRCCAPVRVRRLVRKALTRQERDSIEAHANRPTGSACRAIQLAARQAGLNLQLP
jgi:hypothetical protein